MKTTPPIRWPNRLGWDIPTEHGNAVVMDCGNRLRCGVPAAPRREWITTPQGEQKEIEIQRCRVCEFPLGTDPLDAVAECRRSGLLHDEEGPVPEAVVSERGAAQSEATE
jgi:hypothetical protein